MNILLFKLIATPFFIGSATLAGRRWGSVVNGLIVGLPLTTGPISFILANQYGLEFATKAASGNLAGQVSMCVFCLTYSLVAQKGNWMISAASAITSYLAMTVVLNRFTWQLFPAFIMLLVVIILILRIIPQYDIVQNKNAPPRWDLPARIIIATSFVVSLTAFASILGAQLSGLISTFPIFGVIFATFTHIQQGVQTVSNLLRGIVIGSVSYAFFFIAIGVCLKPLGITLTYGIALGAAMIVSGVFYFATRKGNSQTIEASQ